MEEEENLPISRSLFVNRQGESLQFYLHPCPERVKLRPLIEDRGGIISRKLDKNVFRLVGPNTKVSDNSSNNIKLDFVYDCIKKNKLLAVDNYRIPVKTVIQLEDKLDICNQSSDEEPEPVYHVKTVARNTKARREYTLDDDKEILKFIMKKNSFGAVKGNSLWHEMEASNTLENRTWQSMKERYLKRIIPRLEEFRLPHNSYRALKMGAGMWSRQDQVNFEKGKKGRIKERKIYSSSDSESLLEGGKKNCEKGTSIGCSFEKRQQQNALSVNVCNTNDTEIDIVDTMSPSLIGESSCENVVPSTYSKKASSRDIQGNTPEKQMLPQPEKMLQLDKLKKGLRSKIKCIVTDTQNPGQSITTLISYEKGTVENCLPPVKSPTKEDLNRMKSNLTEKLSTPKKDCQEVVVLPDSDEHFENSHLLLGIDSILDKGVSSRVTTSPTKEHINIMRNNLSEKLNCNSVNLEMSPEVCLEQKDHHSLVSQGHSQYNSAMSNCVKLSQLRKTMEEKLSQNSSNSNFYTCSTEASQDNDTDSMDELLYERARECSNISDKAILFRRLKSRLNDKIQVKSQTTMLTLFNCSYIFIPPQHMFHTKNNQTNLDSTSQSQLSECSLTAMPFIQSISESLLSCDASTYVPDQAIGESQPPKKDEQPAPRCTEKRKRMTRDNSNGSKEKVTRLESSQTNDNQENKPLGSVTPPLAERNQNRINFGDYSKYISSNMEDTKRGIQEMDNSLQDWPNLYSGGATLTAVGIGDIVLPNKVFEKFLGCFKSTKEAFNKTMMEVSAMNIMQKRISNVSASDTQILGDYLASSREN